MRANRRSVALRSVLAEVLRVAQLVGLAQLVRHRMARYAPVEILFILVFTERNGRTEAD